MQKVAIKPIRAKNVSPNNAKITVAKAEPNINGYPALQIGKAIWPGGSDQENFSI
jgi:hypothetical protein